MQTEGEAEGGGDDDENIAAELAGINMSAYTFHMENLLFKAHGMNIF